MDFNNWLLASFESYRVEKDASWSTEISSGFPKVEFIGHVILIAILNTNLNLRGLQHDRLIKSTLDNFRFFWSKPVGACFDKYCKRQPSPILCSEREAIFPASCLYMPQTILWSPLWNFGLPFSIIHHSNFRKSLFASVWPVLSYRHNSTFEIIIQSPHFRLFPKIS
jgi:hypothetical protein